MSIKIKAAEMKLAAPKLAAAGAGVRSAALSAIAQALEAHKEEIFAANKKDLAAADEKGVSPQIKKRLKFDESKLHACLAGIRQLAAMPDPVGKVLLERQLDEGLTLKRISVPIGVIGVIFEARPDALVQISALCIRSGNCAILKGGSETARSNRALFTVIRNAAVSAGLPENCLFQAESHSDIDELLSCDGFVDLLIPRGSNAFVRYIMDHTKIPVMGHAEGVCHVYVDRDADFAKAIPIVVDAKCQYTAACNAAETLLVDAPAAEAFLPKAAKALQDAGVTLYGDEQAVRLTGCAPMTEDWHTEYLDLKMSVRVVDGVQAAVEHINRYGSHHTDAIITENKATAATFEALVDSADVYCNCSTRFADGFRYGFGAEVGISTGKLHARGPVGIEGLQTYKYILEGSGQTVAPYCDGRKEFHFKDITK